MLGNENNQLVHPGHLDHGRNPHSRITVNHNITFYSPLGPTRQRRRIDGKKEGQHQRQEIFESLGIFNEGQD